MATASVIGLMPPPPGVVPDFNTSHITSTQLSFIIAYSVTLALAAVALALRLYTRISICKAFGLDDVAVCFAMACSVIFFALSVHAMNYGFGRHMWEVTAGQMDGYLKELSAIVGTYAWAPAFTKLSLLILLYRVNPNPWFRVAVYGTAFLVVSYTLAISLVIQLPCSPLKNDTGICLDQCGLWQAILNIVTDVMIMVLPMPMLYRLNLPFRQKVVLGSIFSTGIFVVIICIVRITYIRRLQNNLDVTYSQGRAAVWSSVEINIGIVCNCVVVLKPAIRKHLPDFFPAFSQRSTPALIQTTKGRFPNFESPQPRDTNSDSFQMMSPSRDVSSRDTTSDVDANQTKRDHQDRTLILVTNGRGGDGVARTPGGDVDGAEEMVDFAQAFRELH